MTAGNIETALLELNRGQGVLDAKVSNLQRDIDVSNASLGRATDKVDKTLTAHQDRLAELTQEIQSLQRDLAAIKAEKDKFGERRWAIALMLLSALTAAGTTLLTDYFKKR